jgi:hypothetical protein
MIHGETLSDEHEPRGGLLTLLFLGSLCSSWVTLPFLVQAIFQTSNPNLNFGNFASQRSFHRSKQNKMEKRTNLSLQLRGHPGVRQILSF